MQKQALESAHHYEREAKERLRRMSVIAAGLEVPGSRNHHVSSRPIDEAWYDDARTPGQTSTVDT